MKQPSVYICNCFKLKNVNIKCFQFYCLLLWVVHRSKYQVPQIFHNISNHLTVGKKKKSKSKIAFQASQGPLGRQWSWTNKVDVKIATCIEMLRTNTCMLKWIRGINSCMKLFCSRVACTEGTGKNASTNKNTKSQNHLVIWRRYTIG